VILTKFGTGEQILSPIMHAKFNYWHEGVGAWSQTAKTGNFMHKFQHFLQGISWGCMSDTTEG